MVKEWISTIRTIVREEIKFLQKYDNNQVNTMKAWVGVVDTVSIGDNTATIILAGERILEGELIPPSTNAKQNKTGQNLLNGDEIILFSMSGKLSDSFIMVAKKKYINNS